MDAFLAGFEPKDCQEAMVMQRPAMHAAELIVDLVCQAPDATRYFVAVPSKKHGDARAVERARWAAFAKTVKRWKPAPSKLSATTPPGWDRPTYEFFHGFLAVVGIYQHGVWTFVPLRGSELGVAVAQTENEPVPRWPLAMAALLGDDPQAITAAKNDERRSMLEREEEGSLWVAIRDNLVQDMPARLKRIKYMPRDDARMYQLVMFALEQGRPLMAAAIFDAGTPLRLNNQPHSTLTHALELAAPCGMCSLEERKSRANAVMERLQAALEATTTQGMTDRQGRLALVAALQRDVDERVEKQFAAWKAQAGVESLRLDNKAKIDADPRLAFAQSIGSVELRAALGGQHVDAHQKNQAGENLLFFALSDAAFSALALALIDSRIDSVSANTSHGVTPLMLAAGNSSADVVQKLVDLHKNINAVSKTGDTALMYAASAGKAANVKVLLNAGADASLKDKRGDTALQMARQQGFAEVAAALSADSSKAR